MNFMADVDVAIRIAAVLESFVDFLFFHRNIKPSLMFRKFYQALKRVDGFYKPAEQYIDKIIAGELGYVDWRIMEAEPGFAENANISYLYLWAKNKEEIYQSIRDEFKDLLDEQSLDLLEYLKQTTFRLDGQSQFTSLWDWSSWEGVKDKTTEPEKRSVTYITVAEPIVWRDLDPLQFRFAHTKILNDDGSLTELNKFILRF
jgi:hypothetical protein